MGPVHAAARRPLRDGGGGARTAGMALTAVALAAGARRAFGGMVGTPRAHVAVVPVEGVIQPGSRTGASPNADSLRAPLERAFSTSGVRAVCLMINSPGGSPVQASRLFHELRTLSTWHAVPTFAFVQDLCASGAYYVACACDSIYVGTPSLPLNNHLKRSPMSARH